MLIGPKMIAEVLEEEAYRLRAKAKFDHNKDQFLMHMDCFEGSVNNGYSDEEKALINSLARREMELKSLTGMHKPEDSGGNWEKHRRTLVFAVGGQEYELRFIVHNSKRDGYSHDRWLTETHAPTQVFVEKFPLAASCFEDVFSLAMIPDIFCAESQMRGSGKKIEDLVREFLTERAAAQDRGSEAGVATSL